MVKMKRLLRVLGRFIGISRQVRIPYNQRARFYARTMHLEALIMQFFQIFFLLRYKWPKRHIFSDWQELGSIRGDFWQAFKLLNSYELIRNYCKHIRSFYGMLLALL